MKTFWKFHFEFFLKILNFKKKLIIIYNFEILENFDFMKNENFVIFIFFVYCHEYQITAHPYRVEFHQ